MKIAIISDSHDNVANLEKFIAWANENKISILIHAGDVCAPSILKKVLAPKFKGEIHLIVGNVGDPGLLEKLSQSLATVKYYGKKGEIEVEGKKIAFVHFPEEAEKLVVEKDYDLMVFGHTHETSISKKGSAQLLNPGTIGGLFGDSTFAIYDTKTEKIEIKHLEEL